MRKRISLILGDVVTLAILTVVGFATHGETNLSILPRMAAVFFPLLFSWFVLIPWFGLLDISVIHTPKYLWRIPLAFLFAAPLAVILRGAWLNAPVLPLFALIFGASNALGMMVWRWAYLLITNRKR